MTDTQVDSHIKHGFLADVYEPWVEYEGTEWGDQMRALHMVYSMGEDYAGLTETQLSQIEAILREKLQELYETGDLFGFEHSVAGYNEYHQQQAKNAVAMYSETRRYWFNRASTMWKDEDYKSRALNSFAEAEKLVPDWMKE